jgi:hypothetical protein
MFTEDRIFHLNNLSEKNKKSILWEFQNIWKNKQNEKWIRAYFQEIGQVPLTERYADVVQFNELEMCFKKQATAWQTKYLLYKLNKL